MVINDNGKERINDLNPEVRNRINRIIDRIEAIDGKMIEVDSNNVRFQDFFDISKDSKENIEYFQTLYTSNDIECIIQFCRYILSKELKDVFFAINDSEFKINVLFDIINVKNILADVEYCLDYIESLLLEKQDKLNLSSNVNFMITFEDITKITEIITKNKTGSEDKSFSRAQNAIKTLSKVRYNSPENSRKIHKVIDNSANHDVKLTTRKIRFERYSTSGSTKVFFLKMPIIPQNQIILSKICGNKNFESIYFIVGCGDFSCSGYDEYTFYKDFLKLAYENEDEIQKIVDLVVNPLIYEDPSTGKRVDRTGELMSILERSFNSLNFETANNTRHVL